MPPPRQIYDVINEYEIATYIATGRHTADKISGALADAGLPLEGFTSVLDFGCGCGRVIRHWQDNTHARWHGCDYNPTLVEWCRRNLDFARFFVNDLAPPLACDDAAFDLIYANSVFTHLDEALQDRWLAELRRLLMPGGVLLMTTHGDAWREGLDRAERLLYDDARIVVRSAASSGSNLCETYHAPAYFRPLAERIFAEIHHFPKGSSATKEQDVWVLQVAPE